MQAYEYMVVTWEFTSPNFDEQATKQLDDAGRAGWYVIQCVSWGKFMTWTLVRKL